MWINVQGDIRQISKNSLELVYNMHSFDFITTP